MTIDFDLGDAFFENGDYLEDGYTLSVMEGHYDIFGFLAPNPFDGTAYLTIDTETCAPASGCNGGAGISDPVTTVRFTNDGGLAFDLESLFVVQTTGTFATITSSTGASVTLDDTLLGTTVLFSGSDWEGISFFEYSTEWAGTGSLDYNETATSSSQPRPYRFRSRVLRRSTASGSSPSPSLSVDSGAESTAGFRSESAPTGSPGRRHPRSGGGRGERRSVARPRDGETARRVGCISSWLAVECAGTAPT